jgi:cellobiose phosphorylase
VPQAWAAGSIFFLLEAILGAKPDARHRALFVDPKLPDWLPDLTLTNLRIGDQVFDIEFRRDDDETHIHIIKGNPVAVRRRTYDLPDPDTGALAASHAER